jgi:uncharacterized OB-fold protein
MNDISASAPSTANAAFWAAARAGHIELQRCRNCRQLRFFPAPVCPACLAEDATLERMSGRGTVYACTTVHRAPNPSFAKETPYTIALIDLTEGARLMARLENMPAGDAGVGASVAFAGVVDGSAGAWLRFRCDG